jgi:hypothetical protein
MCSPMRGLNMAEELVRQDMSRNVPRIGGTQGEQKVNYYRRTQVTRNFAFDDLRP